MEMKLATEMNQCYSSFHRAAEVLVLVGGDEEDEFGVNRVNPDCWHMDEAKKTYIKFTELPLEARLLHHSVSNC